MPKWPRLILHALEDEIVPYADDAQYVKEQCARGADISFVTFPIAEHISAELLSLPTALVWLGQAFAGKTPKVICGTSLPNITTILDPNANAVLGKSTADQIRGLQGKRSPLGTTINFF